MKKLILLLTAFPFLIFSNNNQSIDNKQDVTCEDITCSPMYRYYIFSDFLYWKTQEGGLDFAYDDALTLPQHGIQGDISRATYEWKAGFRVGFRAMFNNNDWIFEGLYGLICPRGTKQDIPPEGKLLSSTFPLAQSFNLQKATSEIKIRLNFTDMLLEKCFQPTNAISVRYLNGITMMWIKRRWELIFSNNNNDKRIFQPKWNFKGGGVKTGIDYDWYIGKGFNWSGRSAIAGIFGNYDNWMKAFNKSSTNIDTVVENAHLDDFRMVTNLQLRMGPSWQTEFKNAVFKLYLNYETNIWINLSQTNRSLYQNATNNAQSRYIPSSFHMHGLTLFVLAKF